MHENMLGTITHRTLKENPSFPFQYNKQKFKFSLGIFCQDFFGHYGCVNALEFSENGRYLASAGDDRRVLLWSIDESLTRDSNPFVLSALHNSNIFCVAFDSQTHNLFSSGNDEQVIHHDLTRNAAKNVFVYDEAIYGISVDPTNDNIYCVACEDGQILLTDTRTVADPLRIASYMSAFHSVMYNPLVPYYLVTANTKEGVGLWDIRRPGSCLYRYRSSAPIAASQAVGDESHRGDNYATSAKFNHDASLIMTLRRKSGPELYRSYLVGAGTKACRSGSGSGPVCTFDYTTYYNSCTMKSGCFAGQDDQYVVSGSDDFNVYVWKIPDLDTAQTNDCYSPEPDLQPKGSEKCLKVTEPHLILSGHRSIVNQTRFEPARNLLVSSGVEKVIKVWSPNPIGLKDKRLLVHGPNASSHEIPNRDPSSLPSFPNKSSSSRANHSSSLDTGISSASVSSEISYLKNLPPTHFKPIKLFGLDNLKK